MFVFFLRLVNFYSQLVFFPFFKLQKAVPEAFKAPVKPRQPYQTK